MSRYLLAGTALAALATPLAAQTVISTATTQPVRTSQLNNGAGNAVKVTEDGSIKPTGGSAITIDSDHDATNEGTIAISNADGASGIETTGNRVADIVNSGTITIDETYTPTDVDNDGDLDGPFAVGTDRAGIRVRGNLTGDIAHSGKIVVEGNQSAGIVVAGTLDGNLVHDGTTGVLGDQAVAVSMRDVTGDVRLAGTVQGVGEGATGARFAGDIGGSLVVQGAISSTGYRGTSADTDLSKLDADDLLQGGSAVVIEGDVAQGIRFAVAPKNNDANDNDEDKDGIPDDKEGNAEITTYGAAPAVAIGSATRDIAIGAIPATGTGFGLIVDGTIFGSGIYDGVAGNGMVIGGRGGNVAIAGGMSVTGSIAAQSTNGNATALRFGSGASTAELRNSGAIVAKGSKLASTRATALQIDQGASLPYLRNSGEIGAVAADKAGAATAIIDASGTLALIENSGTISATGAEADSGRNVAIDLTSVTSGATIRQTAVASGVTAPSITGDILLGTGADRLEILDGKVQGRVDLGAGEDVFAMAGDAAFTGSLALGGQADTLSLAGTSAFSGDADFAGGAATFTMADKAIFAGKFLNSQNVAVAIEGGTFDLRGAATISSLAVGKDGVLVATLGAETTGLTVSGDASFADGAKLKLRLTDLADATGSYTVLQAGSLSGADDLDTDSTLVPFMYDAALAIDQAAGLIEVDIDLKATEDLGLSRAQSTAYQPLYATLGEDDELAEVFLGITDGAAFRATVAQTLPDHASGSFEGISLGIRTFARQLAAPSGPVERDGKLRIMVDAAAWDSSKGEAETAAYDLDGLGFSGGAELATGLGTVGASATWLWNRHDTLADNNVVSNTYEGAVYYRGDWGPFAAFARGAYGFADFDGARYFRGQAEDEVISRTMDGTWSGNTTSFVAGASVEAGSRYFFMRPSVVLDYVRLDEDGYTETGGGALDLTVEDRTSDELAVNIGTAAGVDLLGMGRGDKNWLRVEAEGGWREILSGQMAATTARFGEGESFTLLPEERESGWFARLRGMGGDEFYTISGEISAEDRNDRIGYALRAAINFAM